MSTSVTKVDFSSGSGKQEKELIVYRSGWKSFGFFCYSSFQILATILMIVITFVLLGENIVSQILAWCGIFWILFCAVNMLRGLFNCLVLHDPVVLLKPEGLHYKDSYNVQGVIAWNRIKGLEITGTGLNKALVIAVSDEKEGKMEETTTHIPNWKVKYDLPQLLSAISEFRNEFVGGSINEERSGNP